MDYIKSNLLSVDLNKTYEAELHNMVQENEVLRIQNQALKLQLLRERKQRTVLQEELKQLRMTYGNTNNDTALCSVKVESRGAAVERIKHNSEKEKVSRKLSESKQKLTDITGEMQREKSLRVQAEADKREAIEIAEELFEIVEKLQKNLVESFLHTQALEVFQPVLQDITEHQKTPMKEQLLEGRCHQLEERRDSSEIKKNCCTTETSMGRGRSQRTLLQPQVPTAAAVLKEGHISKKLGFLHCFI